MKATSHWRRGTRPDDGVPFLQLTHPALRKYRGKTLFGNPDRLIRKLSTGEKGKNGLDMLDINAFFKHRRVQQRSGVESRLIGVYLGR